MAKWSRQRAYTKVVCSVCGVREGTRLCDGVVARVLSWRLCNAPMCETCTTRWARLREMPRDPHWCIRESCPRI